MLFVLANFSLMWSNKKFLIIKKEALLGKVGVFREVYLFFRFLLVIVLAFLWFLEFSLGNEVYNFSDNFKA